MHKLSVIIPVYNAAPYLRRCLDSVREAVRGLACEVLCVDDGSTDESPRLLEEYSAAFGAVDFAVLRCENGGVARARNRALERADGDYVYFMDADDWVEPDVFAQTLSRCERDDLDVCFLDYVAFDDATGRAVGHPWRLAEHPGSWLFDRVFAPAELPRWDHFGTLWSLVIRRSLLERGPLRFRPLRNCSDAVFCYELMTRVKRARCLPQPLYHYRVGNGASISAAGIRRSEDRVALLREFDRILAEVFTEDVPDRLRVLLEGRMAGTMLWVAECAAFDGEDRQTERALAECLAKMHPSALPHAARTRYATDASRNSVSFKVGQVLTWPLRKLYRAWRNG